MKTKIFISLGLAAGLATAALPVSAKVGVALNGQASVSAKVKAEVGATS